jgi:hypothetical protein
MTDFMFYLCVQILKKRANRDKIKFNEIMIAGCKNLTVWSLHYLIQAMDSTKSLLDAATINSSYSVKERTAGCDSISEELVVSFEPLISTGGIISLKKSVKKPHLKKSYFS